MGTRAGSSYQLVSRELRQKVLDGEFGDGKRLPTEAELADSYGVSRQTIRRAFQDLVAEDIVYRVPGRGTFAKAADPRYVRQVGSIDDLMGLAEDTTMRVIEPLARRVDLSSAGRLRQESDAVYRMRFVRMHDDLPFCVTTVFLPISVGRTLAAVSEVTTEGGVSRTTVIGLLDGLLPHPIAEAHQSITVERADPALATHLVCPVDQPLLRIDRLYLDEVGDVVELAVSQFLPEQYSYRIRLRRTTPWH
ncbi:MAG TPA: GntR family transcriptional regulator [Pseudonocardia sp.]